MTDKIPPAVKWHVLPENSNSALDAIGSFELDQYTVQKLMGEFLRGVIEERMKDYGLDAVIREHMNRRTEVAVKDVLQRCERQMQQAAMEAAKSRILELVRDTPINITIEVGEVRA